MIGACSGEGSVNISSVQKNAREFLCLFAFSNYRVTIIIPNFYLDESSYYYGGASNGVDNLYAVVFIGSKTAKFVSFTKGTQNFASGNMTVYYR